MLYGCSNLSILSDISNWITSNAKDMFYMFYGCSNLSNLFNVCSNLLNLPDISKWNTNNIKDMSYILYFDIKFINI